MCGRSRVSLQPDEVLAAARVRQENWRDAEQYRPSFNVAPGFRTPVVRQHKEGDIELQTMTWGLVPSWTRQGTPLDHFRMFNARSESVEEKGVFNRLLKGHRCVVLLNGFYEWAKEHVGKQPYFIYLEGEPVMRMAGLFDAWKGEDGELLYTYTILTTDSSPRLQWLHDRMPVILRTPEDEALWLADRELSSKELATLAHPYDGDDLAWHKVSPAMGKITVQGPEACAELKQHDIASFFQRKAGGKGKAAPAARKAKRGPDAAREEQGLGSAARDTPVEGAAAGQAVPAAASGKGAKPGSRKAEGEAAPAKSPASRRKRPAPATPEAGSSNKARQAAAGRQQSIDAFLVKNSKS
ncbi:hypothetical protein WJX81_001357 [Elliptochloris bilobata]|uniref:Embryonic stem cell-specific 5-hydroxymethylcytosine-binding protein n=1 Tax=Elliptochloris bilobata TaxID=381761 RepID=A0AAW1SH47_9CHLO